MADLTGTLSTGDSMIGTLGIVYGKDGKSAYDIALANGFEGTEQEWLESLKGEQGIQGEKGDTGAKGEKGEKGDTGAKGDTGNPGVYLGSGDMPADCNVQIDPNGDSTTIEEVVGVVVDDDSLSTKPWSSKSTVDRLGIVPTATGVNVCITDASSSPLAGLTLYGKTTQNGTPTPESPVALESAGSSGNIGVTVAGKNLLNYEIIGDSSGSATPYTIDENGYITLNNVSSNKHWPMQIITGLKGKFYSTIEIVSLTTGVNIYVGNSSADHSSVMTQAGTKTYTKEVDGSFYFIVYMPAESSVKFRAIVSADSNTDYEPYKELQTLTASTPNGLPGIPVSSGGNYTDENGQQWICDEIDFARGVYVQRIAEICLDGSVAPNQYTQTGEGMRFGWTGNAGFTPKDYTRSDFAMCNSFKPSVSPIWNNALNGGICAHTKGNIYLRYDAVTSPEAMAEYLTNNPVVYHYVIEKPVEADLSAEELEAYAKLHTNKPNTTVMNDSGAGMAVGYVADTKTYIDNKFTELQNAILASGANV